MILIGTPPSVSRSPCPPPGLTVEIATVLPRHEVPCSWTAWALGYGHHGWRAVARHADVYAVLEARLDGLCAALTGLRTAIVW